MAHSIHPCDYMTLVEREQQSALAEKRIANLAKEPVSAQTILDSLPAIDGYFVRSAIWCMIGDGKLKMTKDRKLITVQ